MKRSESNMNVWIVGVGEPLPIDGKETRLRRVGNLADYISDKNHKVNWFSVSFDHYKKIQRVKTDEKFVIKENYSLHVARVPGYKKNISFKRIIHHRKAAKNIKELMLAEEKPDIIIAGNTPLEVISMVVNYGKKNNIPVIIDIRDLWPEIFIEVVPGYMKSIIKPYIKYSRYKLKKILTNAYAIFGLSEGFLNYGLNLIGRKKSKFDKVIPIGYPDYNYKITSQEFIGNWSENGISNTDFIISFTGNFGKQFDFSSIIQAAEILKHEKNIKFVLCGNGENLEKIKNSASNNIIFTGWIDKNMITSLLAYSSIGIAPYIESINYQMNTPNKFGEYLSAGIPIVVSVDGSMKELLETNNCGYHYSNGKMLAEIIMKYYNNHNMHREHKKNARNLYEKSFKGDKVNESILNQLILISKEYKKIY